jgi:hypothetical protein
MHRHRSMTTGMTILEIMLSLALLGGCMAIIGETARISFQNARIAKDTVQAELLAESIMAYIRLGVIEMESAFEVPVGVGYTNQRIYIPDTHAVAEGSTSEFLWHYSVELTDIEIGLLGEYGYLVEIAVTVRQNLPDAQRPVACRLVRWIAIEPELEEEEE